MGEGAPPPGWGLWVPFSPSHSDHQREPGSGLPLLGGPLSLGAGSLRNSRLYRCDSGPRLSIREGKPGPSAAWHLEWKLGHRCGQGWALTGERAVTCGVTAVRGSAGGMASCVFAGRTEFQPLQDGGLQHHSHRAFDGQNAAAPSALVSSAPF